MRFDDRFLDEVRNRLNISDVVGRKVDWDKKKSQPAKGDYWACCPFHNEKSPSFHADDRRQRYHCFGCGASGDIFRFVTETEGKSFPEAVEVLANEAGVALPARDPDSERRAQQRASLYDVMNLAQSYFTQSLQGADGANARNYLRGRYISPGIQNHFGIGFAPDRRGGLKSFLAERGVDQDSMFAAGLLIAGDDIPVSYDRFRDRVMFPIHDNRGRIIAYGGRALSADQPAKYLNSPETVLFSKSHVLFNHHRVQEPVRRGEKLVVVEGYMDVIACVAHGIRGAVAPLGTALTEDQLRLLWRMSDMPVLCFDGDTAGFKAAGRAADLSLSLLSTGKSLRFALLPDGQDPDDILSEGGQSALERQIELAKNLSDLIWIRETEGQNFDTPERRAELEVRMRSLSKSIKNDTIQRHYAQDFRERIEAFFGTSAGHNRGAKSGQFGRTSGINRRTRAKFTVSRGLSASRLVSDPLKSAKRQSIGPRDAVILMTVVNHPTLLDRYDERFSSLRFSDDELSKLHRSIMSTVAEDPEISADHLRSSLQNLGHDALLGELEKLLAVCRIWQVQSDSDPLDAEQGWLQAMDLEEKSASLRTELQEIERALNENGSDADLARLIEIKQAMASVDQHDALIDGFGS